MSPVLAGTVGVSKWSPPLIPGPEWHSFEQFRVGGSTALEGIAIGSVATLQVKGKTFNILRSEDFQRLVGLAAEVHRLKQGISLVLKAAKMVGKYPDDPDGIELLYQSAALLSESSIFPERDGYDTFQVTEEEAKEHGKEGLDIAASEIPRPKL
jgi:hypothetical protein